jgi:hypothetical protein
MIRTLAAVLLSGAIGAGGIATYDHYRPMPASITDPAQTALNNAIVQNLKQLSDGWAQDAKAMEGMRNTLKQINDAMDLVHYDLVRQEAAQNEIRLQAQNRANRIQNDIANFQKAMPR